MESNFLLCGDPKKWTDFLIGVFANTDAFSFAKHNMIKNINSDRLTNLGKAPCYSNVFAAWCWISGRVVVCKDYWRGCVFDCRSKHFSRMHQRCVESANGYLVGINQLILGVQRQNMKLLLKAIRNQPTKVMLTEPNRFLTAGDFWNDLEFRFWFLNPAANFDAGLESSISLGCQTKLFAMGMEKLVKRYLAQWLSPTLRHQQQLQQFLIRPMLKVFWLFFHQERACQSPQETTRISCAISEYLALSIRTTNSGFPRSRFVPFSGDCHSDWSWRWLLLWMSRQMKIADFDDSSLVCCTEREENCYVQKDE